MGLIFPLFSIFSTRRTACDKKTLKKNLKYTMTSIRDEESISLLANEHDEITTSTMSTAVGGGYGSTNNTTTAAPTTSLDNTVSISISSNNESDNNDEQTEEEEESTNNNNNITNNDFLTQRLQTLFIIFTCPIHLSYSS